MKAAKPKPNGAPPVVVSSDVVRRIRQHARSHMKTEVCGVLIGEKTMTWIDIRESIEAQSRPGRHARHLHPGRLGAHIQVKDHRIPDERIVGLVSLAPRLRHLSLRTRHLHPSQLLLCARPGRVGI